MGNRSIDHLIRSAIRARVVNEFDLGNVTGLTSNPTFTQRVSSRTPEPYICFISEGSTRIDDTKSDTARNYTTVVQVRDSYITGTGGPHICDQLVDEVVRSLDRWTPTISGFNTYIQTVESITRNRIDNENKTYFIAEVEVVTRSMSSVAVSPGGGGGTNLPVQSPIYGFQNFMFTPTSNRIELGDTGGIIPQAIYNSNNNGFDFVDSQYALAAGSDGTLSMGVISVDEDDVVSIVSTLNYENEADTTITETLTETTAFPRIRSLRVGIIDGTSVDVSVINSDVRYGTIAPAGETVVFTAMPGQRGYIAYDATEPDLTAINQQGFTANILSQFTQTTANGYKIYIQDNPFLFANTLTAILQ